MPAFDVLDEGELIPVTTAQFVSLKARMGSGLSLQAAEKTNMVTLEANDFLGNPFVYLNFTAPIRTEDAYSLGASVSGTEWEGQKDESPWTMTVTGAATNRDVLYMNTIGIELLTDITRTTEKLGGPKNIKGLVAPTPMLFWIEDNAGNYWDPISGEVVSDDAIEYHKNSYTQLSQDISEFEHAPLILEQGWKCELDSSQCDLDSDVLAGFLELEELESQSSTSYKFDLESLVKSDGSLNISQAAKAIQTQIGTEIQTQGVFAGDLVAGRQAHYPLDRPASFGRHTTHFSAIPRCTFQIGDAYQTNSPMGCGPAAFIAIMWREWAGYDAGNGKPAEAGIRFYGVPFPANRNRTDIQFNVVDWNRSYYMGNPLDPRRWYANDSERYNWDASITNNAGGSNYDYLVRKLTERRPNGQLEAQHWLNTCWFRNSGFTTGNSWRDGVDGWLAYQHRVYGVPRMHVDGNTSNGPGNALNKGPKHRILRQALIYDKKPVVALFPYHNRAIGPYHIAPVHRYDKSGRGLASTVHVSSLDKPFQFMNIGAWWVLEAGVFYVEKY